ncbi:hypothetical protein POJ06DRAFT_300022 [Lipomyces tetrasporus]|uniref:U1-C C2H2-type zinc finger domain-containing protein n=1 Tax=Lipomyces tetrasporus TaxID=54092 RepID=A0AAD7QVA6_9ASCO|nr:uncharacterized protein POJ06DRAFT_300022 [Lipomyces tetrasporus]KAJ8102124.1 hypothetical protein POJ06DRAFT_300022 [Lipomyces tetrasporus]
MSKYWCKPCKTFVLDTKLGRSQHEASVRHKSSMDRTLRDLHRQKAQSERNERDAKRILAGIERSVSGSSSKHGSTTASKPGIGHARQTAPTVGSVSVSRSSPVSAPSTYKPGPSTSRHAGSAGSQPLGGSQATTTSNTNRITKPRSGSGYSSGQLFSNGSNNAIRR